MSSEATPPQPPGVPASGSSVATADGPAAPSAAAATAGTSPAASASAPSASGRPSVWGKMEHLMAEYGPIALGTYLTIFGLTWAGFAAAISMGVAIESAAGGAGLMGASWLATKVTQPLRIGATAVLTPVVARYTRRRAS